MSNGLHADRQLYLFEKRLAWHQFPADIRQEVTAKLAMLCIEIVDLPNPNQKEQHDERTED